MFEVKKSKNVAILQLAAKVFFLLKNFFLFIFVSFFFVLFLTLYISFVFNFIYFVCFSTLYISFVFQPYIFRLFFNITHFFIVFIRSSPDIRWKCYKNTANNRTKK